MLSLLLRKYTLSFAQCQQHWRDGARHLICDGMIAAPKPQDATLGTPRTRAVHRAIAEARRGVPVVLAARRPLIIAPAETIGAEGLRLIDLLSNGEAVLLLAPSRAAAVLGEAIADAAPVIALKLARPLIDAPTLKRAADPTLEQILPQFERTAAPEAAEAALALGKLARLLPAIIAAPVRPGWASLPAGADLLSVPATDLLAYPLNLAASLSKVAEVAVPLEGAEDARLIAFRALDQGIEHMVIVVGDPAAQAAPLVRVHSRGICWVRCAAIAGRNCAARSPAWPPRAPARCCTSARRAAASG